MTRYLAVGGNKTIQMFTYKQIMNIKFTVEM